MPGQIRRAELSRVQAFADLFEGKLTELRAIACDVDQGHGVVVGNVTQQVNHRARCSDAALSASDRWYVATRIDGDPAMRDRRYSAIRNGSSSPASSARRERAKNTTRPRTDKAA